MERAITKFSKFIIYLVSRSLYVINRDLSSETNFTKYCWINFAYRLEITLVDNSNLRVILRAILEEHLR